MQFLLGKIADLALGRPRTVLLVAALLTALSAATIPSLDLVTSVNAMMPEDDPVRQGFESFMAEFGGMGDLIVVGEGEDPAALAAFADDVAARLAKHPDVVAEVFHRVPVDFFKDKALLYVPLSQLTELADQLAANPEEIHQAASARGLADLLRLLEMGMGRAMTSGQDLAAGGAEMIGELTAFFRELDAHLAGKAAPLQLIERLYDRAAGQTDVAVDRQGYLRSRDQGLVFVFCRSALSEEMADVVRFVDLVKREIAAARPAHPAVTAAGVTGFPAHTYEDMTSVKGDLVLTTMLSLVGVALLFAAAFGSARKTVLALLPLISGTLMALGVTWVIYGYVHLLSSAFFVILIGMGIDFGIHVVARFNEELRGGAGTEAALRTTILRAGRGIMTSALTSAVAFFAIGSIEFQAFAELGIIAGCGLLTVLGATLFELPALLILIPTPAPGPLKEGHSPLAARLVGGVLRGRVPVLVVAAALVGVAGWRTTHIPFDYDYMKLLPKGSESAAYQTEMVERSDYSAEFSAAVAGSLEESARLAAAFAAKPTVARVEAIGRLVPPEQPAKLGQIARLKSLLAEVPAGYADLPPVDLEALGAVLEALYDRVERAQELAFAAKKTAVTNALGELLEVLEELEERLEEPAAAARATEFQQQLFAAIGAELALLHRNLARTAPLTPAEVPPSVGKRFSSGERFAVYAFPKGSIWNREFLERFVNDTRDVSPEATGFALKHWAFVGLMHRDFGLAAMYAGLAILAMLLLDFRSLRRTLLAVIPLGVGVVWMLGLMNVFDFAYNFANLPCVPLIIGIGVASGVHLTHRFAQDGEREVLPAVLGTGRGILLSALTTMVAFGTLAMSTHQGLASFGWVLLLGVGSCLVASLVVLPAALEVFSRVRRSR